MIEFTGNILIVDGDAKNRELLRQRLSEHDFNVFCAESGNEVLNLINTNQVDLVLLDASIPDVAGMDVLKKLRQTYTSLQLPVIVMAEKTDVCHAAAMLDAGANDHVTRPVDFTVVLVGIQTQLEKKRTEEALRKSEEGYMLAMSAANDGLWDWDLETNKIYFSPKWKFMAGETEDFVGDAPDEWFGRIHTDDIERVRRDIQAHIDGKTPHYENEYRLLHKDGTYLWMLGRGLALRNKDGKAYRIAGWQTDITRGKIVDFLTGLPNRVLFMDQLALSFNKIHTEKNRTFALIYLDLDNFKLINDSLGHAIGDQLLAAIARRLEKSVSFGSLSTSREIHTVARLGGDEFVILVDNAFGPMDVIHIVNRVLAGFDASFYVQDHELFPKVSVGIAFYNNTYLSPDALLQDAEIAMNRAKLAGKGRFEIFDADMRATMATRLQLETEFRHALERKEFEVYYQPVISMKTGRIHGFEALTRWRNPARGLVSPLDFIPMAEETGLIIPLGQWVLETACRQTCLWHSRFKEVPPSISVNLSARHFLQSNLLVHCHTLLGDMAVLRNNFVLEVTEGTLMQDYDASIKLMRRLKAMGIRIAIDDFGTGYSSLSYLHKFPFDSLKIDQSFIARFEEDGEIVRTILVLGHALGLKVVAEGLETLKQVNELRKLGCDYGQGYYFSKPVTAQEATVLLETWDNNSLISVT